MLSYNYKKEILCQNLMFIKKTILNLLSDTKADFLIPDYQRPYAWNQDQCQTLWDDLVNFTIPGGNHEKFDSKKDEYFLGSIVAFQENEKHEIIDGQQRLTTFMLILRAFHKDFENRQDNNGINIRQNIEKCIWKYDEFENPLKDELKITSEVAGDDDKDEFL